jgi:coenzyme F420-0:L-glutamate ligase/coenzyme F420-1:gamma-L-glutamate ligase
MLTLTPFKTARRSSPFDLLVAMDELVGERARDGDILVVSSKFVAISEGRVVALRDVKPGGQAKELSARFEVPPELCELIIQESDKIIGGVSGFVLTLWKGLLTPNAGIDKSNIEHGKVVLYPKDPLSSAQRIADAFLERRSVTVGVVISDSRLMPTRMGTVGVALAAVGFNAVRDMRGHPDLFGNPLKVTRQAIADDLCSGAQLVMGEADEASPVVLVRGLQVPKGAKSVFGPEDFAVPVEQCVFMGSLGYSGDSKDD